MAGGGDGGRRRWRAAEMAGGTQAAFRARHPQHSRPFSFLGVCVGGSPVLGFLFGAGAFRLGQGSSSQAREVSRLLIGHLAPLLVLVLRPVLFQKVLVAVHTRDEAARGEHLAHLPRVDARNRWAGGDGLRGQRRRGWGGEATGWEVRRV